MRDFRLPPRYKWALRSSGMLRSTDLQLVTDVTGQASGPSSRVILYWMNEYWFLDVFEETIPQPNYTRAKLYHRQTLLPFTPLCGLRSSQELSGGGAQSDRKAGVNYIQTIIAIFKPICKSVVNDYVCRSIQYETQQMGNVQIWQRILSSFKKGRSRLCVFLHFYFLATCQIFTRLGMKTKKEGPQQRHTA